MSQQSLDQAPLRMQVSRPTGFTNYLIQEKHTMTSEQYYSKSQSQYLNEYGCR